MDMWRKYRKTVVAMSVVGAVLAAGCGGALADNTPQGTMPATSRPAPSTGTLSDARNTPAVRVAKSVGPAVVGITNRAVARDWFNHQFEVEQGVGSGVIFREDGYIVTNYHVVAGAKEIMVSLSDGRSVKGKMVGADELTDIAVVKIDGEGFPTAAFGNSDDIVVGEPAIAIGNPMGLEFQGSVTVGVISALNRTLDISERHLKLIQTDAAISPGNSGGALANADGLVIGINSAKIAANGVEGMGFALRAERHAERSRREGRHPARRRDPFRRRREDQYRRRAASGNHVPSGRRFRGNPDRQERRQDDAERGAGGHPGGMT